MRALFEADPEDKTGGTQANRKSFESGEMFTALDSARQNSQAENSPKLILAAAESVDDKDPRFRIGGNHPPPEELIPERLQQSPGGPAVQFLDNLLDITGPGDEANLEVATLQMRALLHAIHDVDPNYVYESLEPPGGLAGMSRQGRLTSSTACEPTWPRRSTAYGEISGPFRK